MSGSGVGAGIGTVRRCRSASRRRRWPTPSVIMHSPPAGGRLLLLLVVAALLGMHGLATAHHARAVPHQAVMASSPEVGGGASHLSAGAVPPHLGGDVASPADAASSSVATPGGGAMPHATAMCVAVLTAGTALGLAALGLARRRRPVWRQVLLSERRMRSTAGPPGLLRPSLAALCVLRS